MAAKSQPERRASPTRVGRGTPKGCRGIEQVARSIVKRRILMKAGIVATSALAVFVAGAVNAAEIKVLSTQATEQSYRALVPQFEKATGHRVTTIFTGTLDADRRLAAGEKYDLLIMSRPSIEEHIKDGKLLQGSRVDLAKSGVGVAIRPGAKKPDISTADALKKTLLSAKSI